ncbi:LpqB family beta-propeller domain-containing protein [Paenarthrobacter aurescens]|uniref:Lipoprotein LpqB n=1 Tax=Paenarthrobacter aurescens TaxID=43663 RepID=A0A4Y3ND16_PAEAU|nr:LpqB family beta-propeller domain-containing protein [Paenarthrobacter aurescens]MDO6144118.1 LpqB family beta-propeller domain-containing protein [Paenarthrobacter aurescens]MDO6147965.1 LpqB family beta-propeller domain-containing protein [Paenarthrobacter aurescens]MDO6159209.1 LpqB family beta-propeller domain-containing protein [Paenarthrobacter aurescens]MDO6163193.1 LpqB family beta-propeller domain-containing protein [Paenarthrobacter aurescens]GEB18325.1 lipoprotein LpqB [Paenarthr
MKALSPKRSRILAALLAVVMVLLASCAQIPRSGPVGKSKDEGAGNPNAPVFFPAAPRPGSSPESVIEDFYMAGSGYEDDYPVARQFLTQAQSVTWKPDKRALVFREAQVVKAAGENEYVFELDLAYSVDADGVATQFPPGTKETIPLTLEQVEGEWRISKVPDGTAILEETFKVIYGANPIYFYDPTFTYAVPDYRWFIKKNTVKSMTSALLAGPAPYLRGAVVSAFPSGMKLARESVPVVSGAAQVDLSAKELFDASAEDRQRMQNQLALTFRSQPDVINVQLRADQDLVRVEDNGTVLPPVLDKSVPARQIAVNNGDLVRYENNRVTQLPDIQSVAGLGPHSPAESPVSQTAAFLNGDKTTLYSIEPGQPARQLTTRSTLTGPSFSPNDWVWTAGPGATGAAEVVAYKPTGIAPGAAIPNVTMTPAWLTGRTVKDFRVSREGTRALVISEANGKTAVQITGIVRNTDGVPKDLTLPITLLGSSAADQGAWVNGSTVAVMSGSATATVVPELLSLASGEPQQLAPWDGLTSLSVGNGAEQIYGQSADGIFQRVGNGWELQLKGPTEPAFPG